MSVVTARLTARLTAAHGAERPDELLVAENFLDEVRARVKPRSDESLGYG